MGVSVKESRHNQWNLECRQGPEEATYTGGLRTGECMASLSLSLLESGTRFFRGLPIHRNSLGPGKKKPPQKCT